MSFGREVIEDIEYDTMIYTSQVDYFFACELGKFKYRSMDVMFVTKDTGERQPAIVVNFPNDYDYTYITEYEKLTSQKQDKAVISKEYPSWEGEPYYPIPVTAQ